jgi:competence protein ComK
MGGKMLNNYNINDETLAIIPISDSISKIIEEDSVYFVNKPAVEVLNDSCKYFGSSYHGRSEGTKSLIGHNYKAPVLVQEKNSIIFFPTLSPRDKDCQWISLNNIKEYARINKTTVLTFTNGSILPLNISYYMLENQLYRATKLRNVLNERINSKK